MQHYMSHTRITFSRGMRDPIKDVQGKYPPTMDQIRLTNRVHDDLCDRYTDIERDQRGSYGAIYRGVHRSSSKKVAIRRIARLDHPVILRCTLREIVFLKHFRHENVSAILDIKQIWDLDYLSAIYLIEDYLPMDLEKVLNLQRTQSIQGFTDQQSLSLIHI